MREKLEIHLYFLDFKSLNKPIIIIICYICEIIPVEYVLIVFPLMINISMSYVWIRIWLWYNLKRFVIELNLRLCGLLCYNIFIQKIPCVRNINMILHQKIYKTFHWFKDTWTILELDPGRLYDPSTSLRLLLKSNYFSFK